MKFLLFALGGVVLLVLMVLFLLRRRAAASGEKLTALVFLMSRPRPLSEDEVRQAIQRAWGVELGSEMQQGGDWLVEADKVNPAMAQPGAKNFLVSALGRMFLINSVNRPYMEGIKEFAETIPDMRLRRAVGEHTAWNSVDLFGEPPSEEEKPQVYELLGKLLAEFASDDCLALYSPELGRCNEYSPAIVEALKSGPPLAIFEGPTFAPIVQVKSDDPRMVAAVEEARRRWPEFVAAFQKRNAEFFAVKARFTEGDDEEFMWVSVQTLEGDSITGQLGNTPGLLKSIKEGDTVTVQREQINDWIYGGEGQSTGGFTQKVMEEMINKNG